MPDLYLIMNHRLTALQEEDARRTLRVGRIVSLPEQQKQIWEQIPADIAQIRQVLRPVADWLEANATESDFVLIQGDFGACYLMVHHAMDRGLIPVYSTTTREAVEAHHEDGSVQLTHRFRHQRFRRYGI